VASMIIEHGRLEHDPTTGLSGRARVTQKMFEADVLLLLHGDYEWCAEYIPSKYYEYLWAQRPLVALTNRNSQFDQLLADRNTYLAGTLDPGSIEEILMDVWNDWTQDQLRRPAGDPVSVESAVNRIIEEVRR
jgi:hypothetical protein